MRIRALVQNKVMLILVDSDSSHSFVSQSFLDQTGILTRVAIPLQVRVANGEVMQPDKQVHALEWWAQGYIFHTDMRVLSLAAYDAILGYDWLRTRSPMIYHWDLKTLEFSEGYQQVHLQGLQHPDMSMDTMSPEQFVKWQIGNNIWALAVIQITNEPADPSSPPTIIASVLDQFQDVFVENTQLPPHRAYDHTIPLLLSAAPVNARPYRYYPLHKDEKEKQVRNLVSSGLITPSTSPLASPVLLVQKKDDTCLFCVDYRRLNSITMKNKFPMPLIDEILDELGGSKFFTKLDFKSGFHQVRMSPADEFKTAFKTHHGHYQFKVMPFGLTNAPATFQCIMNAILEPFLRKFVIVFLDNILIYSSTLQEHASHLQQVL
jgi:hypothetical protein